MKRTVALFLAFILLFALCACGEKAVQAQPSAEPGSEPTPAPPTTPQKIVSVGPNCTELLCALGLGDKVIGQCMVNHSLGKADAYSEQTDAIPVLCEGYPTESAVINSGCDFVLAYKWAFTEDFTAEALQSAGIEVFICEATTLDAFRAEVRALGGLFEISDAAESYIAEQTALIEAVMAALAGTESKTVLVYDSYLSGGYIYVSGQANLETELLALAGGVNVCADCGGEWGTLKIEDVTSLDPDYMIIHDYSGTSAEDKVAFLESDPILRSLDCVRNGYYLIISLEDIFPGPHAADTVQAFAKALHPECFAENAE